MKHELNIWVVGGDLRQEKLAQLLAEDVRRLVHTLRQSGVPKEEALALVDRLWEDDGTIEEDLS